MREREPRQERGGARDRVSGRGHRDVEIIGEGEKFATRPWWHDGEKFSSASIRSRSCDLPKRRRERSERKKGRLRESRDD